MASADNSTCEFKQSFNERVFELLVSKRGDNSFFLTDRQYRNVLNLVKEAKVKRKKETRDYRRLARYDIRVVGDQEKLIKPISHSNPNVQYFVSIEEAFDILHATHLSIGHGGRNRMVQELKKTYCNITKEMVMAYLSFCKPCQQKKASQRKVSRPILSNHLNSRGQVDLLDMKSQPSKDYRYIMVYQDQLTKFIMLRALKTNSANEVAFHLLDIFTTIGAPVILQSDDGREFANRVIVELCSMWNEIKIVHGQSQGSGERASHDIEEMLTTWMAGNQTSDWEAGLKFIQFMKNRAYHEDIKRSPYEALFGCKAKVGLSSSSLPADIIQEITTEEDLMGLADDDKSNPSVKEEGLPVIGGMSSVYNSVCIICSKPATGATEGGAGKVTCDFCLRNGDVWATRNFAVETLEDKPKKRKLSNDNKQGPSEIGANVVPAPWSEGSS